MRSEATKWLPLNLQFFAENDGENDGNANGHGDDGNEAAGAEGTGGNDEGGEGEGNTKTFTQSEMNAIAAKEKKQGRRSVLKELGFKSETNAKEELEAFRQWKESQMSDEEKAKRDADENAVKQQELLDRALKAEQKLAALATGVRPDSIDDAIAIANLKVTDEKDLSSVLEDMKKEARYAGFFDKEPEEKDKDSNSGTGTGSSTKHSKRGGSEAGNIGQRLGKQRSASMKKSSFFKN